MADSIIQRPPGTLNRLLIPETVLRNTIMGLSYAAGRETLCYWLGSELKGQDGQTSAIVTTAAFPHIKSAYAQFQLIEGQMGLITTWCHEHNVWVLAQVHTHPTDEPHSEADECWPASHRRGFLSIVFPYFASMSSVLNPAWRIYECKGEGQWNEITTENRLLIMPDVWFPKSS
jgi:hypothetical protein